MRHEISAVVWPIISNELSSTLTLPLSISFDRAKRVENSQAKYLSSQFLPVLIIISSFNRIIFITFQKSVNAVRAVRRLSSMSSLFSAKAKSKSVVKLDEPPEVKPIPLAETKRDFSKSMPSVFAIEGGQLNKRAMKILDSDTEASQR